MIHGTPVRAATPSLGSESHGDRLWGMWVEQGGEEWEAEVAESPLN